MFRVWVWHAVAVIAVFAFGGLPSFYIKKIVERFQIHQPLERAQVYRVRVGGKEVEPALVAAIVEAFNQAVFLRRRDAGGHNAPNAWPGGANGQPTAVYGLIELILVTGERICVWPDGREVGIHRLRHKKRVVYQVHSPALQSLLNADGRDGTPTKK